jgi:hypothetical protein
MERKPFQLYTVKPMPQPGSSLKPHTLGYPERGVNALFFQPSLVTCIDIEGVKIDHRFDSGLFIPLEDPRKISEIREKAVYIKWNAITTPKTPKGYFYSIIKSIWTDI